MKQQKELNLEDILNYVGINLVKVKKNKSTFIFSFNNKQKYLARNDNDSITFQPDEGPRFGCGWPEINFNGTLDKGESYIGEYSTFIGNKSLTNGKQNWNVKELKVHKIIYI